MEKLDYIHEICTHISSLKAKESIFKIREWLYILESLNEALKNIKYILCVNICVKTLIYYPPRPRYPACEHFTAHVQQVFLIPPPPVLLKTCASHQCVFGEQNPSSHAVMGNWNK